MSFFEGTNEQAKRQDKGQKMFDPLLSAKTMDKEQLAKQHANSTFKTCHYPNNHALLTDYDAKAESFLAGYEASEKNAEQERIKAKIEVLEEIVIEAGLMSTTPSRTKVIRNKIDSLKTLLDNDRT